ncbi:PIR protein [Plasmodium ovale]|uniref:PIR Superfamily Protein n=2 Tax=Plasmodium ovale TaxID=36330 RepID=A0A1A8WEF5_PLAOA|nr:PIR Superfamily Protein [Plasmodium ovale curtisi]SBT02985.1 PIR Superfamily Protein [Plasmodium ovale curtisi]SCP04366.1 PIR protein [Plasmodium ovale]
MATLTENEYNDILKDAESYNKYEKLNLDVEYNKRSQRCNVFNTLRNHRYEAYNLCNKIVRNFKDLSESSKLEDETDKCLHYKYWIYGKIWNMFKSKRGIDYDIPVITEFSNLEIDITKGKRLNDCRYDFTYINMEDLKIKVEKKYLHDYFKNYNIIERNITCNNGKHNIYKKYLDYISEIYEKYKEECHYDEGSLPKDCSHYYNPERVYNPAKVQLKLELYCKHYGVYLNSNDELRGNLESGGRGLTQAFLPKYSKSPSSQEAENTFKFNIKDGMQVCPAYPLDLFSKKLCVHLEEQSTKENTFSSVERINSIEDFWKYVQKADISLSPETPNNTFNFTSSHIFKTATYALGISLIFFIFYKFHKVLLPEKDINYIFNEEHDDYDEDDEELLETYFESPKMNTHDDHLHVAYNSI